VRKAQHICTTDEAMREQLEKIVGLL